MMSTAEIFPSRKPLGGGTGRDPNPPFLPPADEAALRRQPAGTFGRQHLSEVVSETRGARAASVYPELVPRPPRAEPTASVRVLHAWKGRVVLCEATQFVAILHDQVDMSRPDEQVTIGVNEVDPSDQGLLKEGATFYWSFFEEVRLGTRRVATDLRFRRLPVWTRTEIDEVKRRAVERARRFGIDIDTAETE